MGVKDDLIRRNEAIAYAISGRVRTLRTGEDDENWIRTEEVRESLLTMPSAQQEPRWIPVTERLPRVTKDCLCWVINPHDTKLQYHMICTYYVGANKWCPIVETASDNVVAWLPLPEPYQEGDK